MICCKQFDISISPVVCATEMEVVAVTNATQNFPAFAGIPKWDFGSYIPGFGATPAFGDVQLVFRSPTLKTWRFGGAQFNASGTLVRGWQTSVFSTPPTILLNGVAQSFDMVTVNGADFWIIQGAGLEEGKTFTTDSCSDVTLQSSGTAVGSIFGGRTLIEIEDITP